MSVGYNCFHENLVKISGVLNCDVSNMMEILDESTESEDKVNG
jgi:hypothetical protein